MATLFRQHLPSPRVHPAARERREQLRPDPPIDPNRLDAAARERLANELYAIHCEIFDGVDAEAFRRYVIEAPGADTRIQMYRDRHGTALGYAALNGYLRTIGGRSALIIRGAVGIERRHRGQSVFAPFMLAQVLRMWLRHLPRRKFAFACPIHPSSYSLVTRRVHRSWPRPGVATPSAIEAVMLELADEFGLPPVPGADPLVRQVGWRTRDRPIDREFWDRHEGEEVRLYRTRNPDYADGVGLLMLVPLSLGVLLRLAVNMAAGALGQRVRRSLAARTPTR